MNESKIPVDAALMGLRKALEMGLPALDVWVSFRLLEEAIAQPKVAREAPVALAEGSDGKIYSVVACGHEECSPATCDVEEVPDARQRPSPPVAVWPRAVAAIRRARDAATAHDSLRFTLCQLLDAFTNAGDMLALGKVTLAIDLLDEIEPATGLDVASVGDAQGVAALVGIDANEQRSRLHDGDPAKVVDTSRGAVTIDLKPGTDPAKRSSCPDSSLLNFGEALLAGKTPRTP